MAEKKTTAKKLVYCGAALKGGTIKKYTDTKTDPSAAADAHCDSCAAGAIAIAAGDGIVDIHFEGKKKEIPEKQIAALKKALKECFAALNKAKWNSDEENPKIDDEATENDHLVIKLPKKLAAESECAIAAATFAWLGQKSKFKAEDFGGGKTKAKDTKAKGKAKTDDKDAAKTTRTLHEAPEGFTARQKSVYEEHIRMLRARKKKD